MPTFKELQKDTFAGDSLVKLNKWEGFIRIDDRLFLETKKYQIEVNEKSDVLVKCGKDEANFKKEAPEGRFTFTFPKAFLSGERVELDVLVKDRKVSIATGELAGDLRKAGLDVDGKGYMELSAFDKADLPALHLGKDEMKWCKNLFKHSYEIKIMAGLILEVEKLRESQLVKDFLESKIPKWADMVIDVKGLGFRGKKVYNKGENSSGVVVTNDGTEVELNIMIKKHSNMMTLDLAVREPNAAERTVRMTLVKDKLDSITFPEGKTIELDMRVIMENLDGLREKQITREVLDEMYKPSYESLKSNMPIRP